jgi:hypothetical protein
MDTLDHPEVDFDVTPDDADADTDIDYIADEDQEQEASWGDHLSEQIAQRIRTYAPRTTVAFGSIDTEYAEALIERTELIDDEATITLGVMLVEPDQAQERCLSGLLNLTALDDGSSWELSFTLTEDESFRYHLHHDGRWISSYDLLAEAATVYQLLPTVRPAHFHRLRRRIERAFGQIAFNDQSFAAEEPTPEFIAQILHKVGHVG